MQVFSKTLFNILGMICVALGLIGIFVPIMPTTVFLLLAAFFFARGSNRALQWLLNNRWFGPYIRNYREGRGMAARDKVITLTMLWITMGFSIIFLVENNWVRLVLIGIASGVTLHLLRIKTFHPDRQPGPKDDALESD